MASKFTYGGQAVIEGVMIRGQSAAALAVRRPNGEVVSSCEPLATLYTGPLRKVPFLRGVIVLIETMALGMRALMHSANIALEENEPEAKPITAKESKLTWLMLPFGLFFGIGFFFLVPLFLTKLLDLGSPIAFAAVEGLIRMVFFVIYIAGVSLLPDMKRVFMYHGAEHMTIAAHEHGHPLEFGHIRKFPKEHPRCGTAFLITVMLVAIIVFSLFGIVDPPLWMTALSRLLFVPLIAGMSYEIIKFNSAHENSVLVKLLMTPGIWLQYITTRKPDDKQIAVAVAAMEAALTADGVAMEKARAVVT